MQQSRREQKRAETASEIKAIARSQMAETGAAALSLRAIAREMRMSTPALYRYFENRDALVTALILEAFSALNEQMIAAEGTVDEGDFYGRFQAITHAFRRWALQNPADFTLIYGTPIPGYHAPAEQTIPSALAIFERFGLVFEGAIQHGKLQPPSYYRNPPAPMAQIIGTLHRQVARDNLPEVAITLTLYTLPRVYGLVWAELYGHFPLGFTESGLFFTLEIEAMCQQFGLTP